VGKLLLPSTVSERSGLAVTTLAKLRVTGGGPPFVKIGGARVMYREDDFERWLEDRPVFRSTSELGPSARRPLAGRRSAYSDQARRSRG